MALGNIGSFLAGLSTVAIEVGALSERQRYLCRLPTDAEREALDKGFDALGIQVAFHWPRAGS